MAHIAGYLDTTDSPTTTANIASVAVASGEAILVWIIYDASEGTPSVSSGTAGGTWEAISGATLNDPGGGVAFLRAWLNRTPSAGTHTITVTKPSSAHTAKAIVVSEVPTSGAIGDVAAGLSANLDPAPAGTDGVSSGNITPPTGDWILYGFAVDWNVSGAPVPGTGFTDLNLNGLYSGGPYTEAEYREGTGTSDVAATFTRVSAVRYYCTGIVIDQGGSASTAPTISDVGDELFQDGETGIEITGTNLPTTGGEVTISPTDDVNDAGAVTQTITARSGGTSVTFTAAQGSLPSNTVVYLFVENDSAETNAAGYQVRFPTLPWLTSANVTNSGNNTATTSWAVDYPAHNAGDLVVVHVASDANVTHNWPATGPNGETIVDLVDSFGGTVQRASGFYWVASANTASGTITVTPSATEQWTASVLVVPAGEFDATTPIQATVGTANDTTADTSIDSPTWTSSTAGGRVVVFHAIDTVPTTATPAGWDTIANVDRGAVAGVLGVRIAATTEDEAIAAATWTATSETNSSFGYVINAPAAGGIVEVVGLTTEADSAFAVGSAKARAVGLTTTTDIALAVGAAAEVVVGLATSTEESLAVTAEKTREVGLAGASTALAGSVQYVLNGTGDFDYGRLTVLPDGFGDGEFTLELRVRATNTGNIGQTSTGAGVLQNWANENGQPYDGVGWWYYGNFLIDGHNNSTLEAGTFSLQIFNSGRVRWTFGDGAAAGARVGDLHGIQSSSGINILDGEWHRIACVRRWDGGTGSILELYVDGVLQDAETSTARTNMATAYWDDWSDMEAAGTGQSGWFFGAEKFAALTGPDWADFKGYVTEAAFWSIARDSADLTDGWNISPVGNEPGLVGLYLHDEGTGTAVGDSLASGGNIVLTNPDAGVWSSEAPVVETNLDLALPVAADKAVTVGLTSETDTALPVEGSISLEVGLATETDAPLSPTSAKNAGVALVTEVDSVLATTVGKELAVGLIETTDAAQSVARAKVREVGLVSETDSTFGVTVEGPIIVTAGLTTEVDTAFAIAAAKARAAGLASTTDAALPANANKTAAAGLVEATDSALSVTVRRALTVGQPEETDSAFPATVAGNEEIVVPVGLTETVSTAAPVGVSKELAVVLALETDAAQLVASSKAVNAGLAEETDTVLVLAGPAKAVTVGLATEQDAAFRLENGGSGGTGDSFAGRMRRRLGRGLLSLRGR